ncbi:glucose-6-phosphate dehydrogenase [Kocuria palustris]|uniref:glucose-6-phosphate dehydrogenase n=1 Tax=Kocuria palustris TaxID=71999 RepID=UPI0011A41B13|nr:glucose-6-phosphate dehydrogenase [Kocuria palustris]
MSDTTSPLPSGADPVTLIILGASGDLTSRLLLPGLGDVLALEPQRQVTLVGSARSEMDDWRGTVAEAFRGTGAEGPAVERTLESTAWVTADASSPEDMARLLDQADDGRVILYFALSPSVTAASLQALREIELPEDLWLALEKPIGTDEQSARELNRLADHLAPASRILRVDHFLGEPAVLDLVGLRLANRIIEPLLNRELVESISITFDETLGLEGRAAFYDANGAIRDMHQSHLLQVMGVLMMDPPSSIEDGEIPDLVAQVLARTSVIGPVEESMAAGRYTAGSIDGRRLPSYADEEGVDPAHGTETWARLTVAVDSWRWQGVPVHLRSGKAIGSPHQEVLVRFRPVPAGGEEFGSPAGDILRVDLSTGEISLELSTAGPFDPRGTSRVTLSSATPESPLAAYGSVVRRMLDGDRSFSVSAEASEHSWRIVQPAIDALAEGRVPLQEYPAGSEGPETI